MRQIERKNNKRVSDLELFSFFYHMNVVPITNIQRIFCLLRHIHMDSSLNKVVDILGVISMSVSDKAMFDGGQLVVHPSIDFFDWNTAIHRQHHAFVVLKDCAVTIRTSFGE